MTATHVATPATMTASTMTASASAMSVNDWRRDQRSSDRKNNAQSDASDHGRIPFRINTLQQRQLTFIACEGLCQFTLLVGFQSFNQSDFFRSLRP